MTRLTTLVALFLLTACSKDLSYEGLAPKTDTVVQVIHDTLQTVPYTHYNLVVCGSTLSADTGRMNAALRALFPGSTVQNVSETGTELDYRTYVTAPGPLAAAKSDSLPNLAVTWEYGPDLYDNRTQNKYVLDAIRGLWLAERQEGYTIVGFTDPYRYFASNSASGYDTAGYNMARREINDSLVASGAHSLNMEANPIWYTDGYALSDSGYRYVAARVREAIKR